MKDTKNYAPGQKFALRLNWNMLLLYFYSNFLFVKFFEKGIAW